MLGITNPCVFGEPLVEFMAERTVGPAEEHGRATKGSDRGVSAGGDCPPCFRAMDQKHAHTAPRAAIGAGVPLSCDESIKTS